MMELEEKEDLNGGLIFYKLKIGRCYFFFGGVADQTAIKEDL